jgi:hypothetical protein
MQNLSNHLNVIANLETALSNSRNGITFVAINGYTNASGEVSNNLINVGVSYDRMKQKDINFLEVLDTNILKFKSDLTLIEQARIELIESLRKPDTTKSNGQKNAYTHIIDGIKVHNENGKIYIYGYRENKTIIKEGTYKETKSSVLTLAKNELRSLLKTNKFKMFILESTNTIKCNKETLELS